MTGPAAFTVIIPAHNEESVIARCLQTALQGAPDNHQMQLIVAANGCHDETVAIARRTAPSALVLDLPQGSKTLAMNEAARHARAFPRIFLDADVQCEYRALAALAAELMHPGVKAASPALKMDLSRSSYPVRAYYRVWLTQPYVRRAMVGSGCFGLSEEGYTQIGDFPPITGDDIWVHSRFTESERRSVAHDRDGKPVWFTVSPPRRIIDQIRVETRRRLGNEQVLRLYPAANFNGSNAVGDLRTALTEGASIIDLGVYLAVKFITRLRAGLARRRSATITWERDLSAREI
jgi:glycosyltransferase involved in cell wall biosynthesis